MLSKIDQKNPFFPCSQISAQFYVDTGMDQGIYFNMGLKRNFCLKNACLVEPWELNRSFTVFKYQKFNKNSELTFELSRTDL